MGCTHGEREISARIGSIEDFLCEKLLMDSEISKKDYKTLRKLTKKGR